MVMYCKAQSHNWKLQLNKTGIAICVHTSVRLINNSKKGRSYRWEHNVKVKNNARNDRRRPWRTLRDDDVTDAQKLQWRRDPA